MTQRLELLNSKPVALKPSLHFKPKVVARRSKEDRDKDAPREMKNDRPLVTARGRGSLRGRGRGGRNYAGTHVVTSGPLSSGSVSMGINTGVTSSSASRDTVYSGQRSTSLFIESLRPRDPKVKTEHSTLSDIHHDDEDILSDLTKINMTKGYNFADEDTILFPVRPVRDSASLQTTRSGTLSPSTPVPEEVKVKQEAVELDLLDIKLLANDQHTEADEIKQDQQDLHDLLQQFSKMASTDIELSDGTSNPKIPSEYFAFHLPALLPQYQKAIDTDPIEIDEKPEEEKPTSTNPLKSTRPRTVGQVGTLNVHRSGKITINLGNDINLGVNMGNSQTFAQELFVIESNDRNNVNMEEGDGAAGSPGKIVRLGTVGSKIVATPILE